MQSFSLSPTSLGQTITHCIQAIACWLRGLFPRYRLIHCGLMTPYCVMTPYSVTTPCTVIDQRQLHWSLFTGVIIGSVNGLAPNQQQVITWTNDDFYEQMSMKFWKFIFTEDNALEMLSSKWWPFCFSHNVPWGIYQIINTKTNTFFFHIQTFIYHRSAHISLHANRKIRVTKKQLDVLQTKMFQNTDKFHMYGLSMTKKVSYKNLDLNFLFVQLAHLIQILPEVMIKKNNQYCCFFNSTWDA